ncbi:hypothetical protein Tco_0145543, partial [Tanacetum coccineum]
TIQVKYNMTPGLIMSNQELLLANTSKEATWLWQEAQEKLDFALSTLTQQTQGLTMDCHAGNPCDPNERSNGSKSLPND